MTKLLIRLFIRDPANIQDRTVRTAYGNLACMVGIVCNVLLFAGKFTVGTLFGSMAIAADALNNLSDASSNVVSLVGFRLGCFGDFQLFQLFAAALGHFGGGSAHHRH